MELATGNLSKLVEPSQQAVRINQLNVYYDE